MGIEIIVPSALRRLAWPSLKSTNSASTLNWPVLSVQVRITACAGAADGWPTAGGWTLVPDRELMALKALPAQSYVAGLGLPASGINSANDCCVPMTSRIRQVSACTSGFALRR